MLEVPADKDIDSGYRGEGDVQSIRAHALGNSAVVYVSSSQFFRFGGNRDELDVCVRHARHCLANCVGSGLQFPECEIGQNEDKLAGNKCLNQTAR